MDDDKQSLPWRQEALEPTEQLPDHKDNDSEKENNPDQTATRGCRILDLPSEMLERILQACAANGAFARCAFDDFALCSVCKTFSQVVGPLLPVPGDFDADCVERIVIRVDPTYQNGEWLKVSFFWRSRRRDASSELFQLAVNPQDLSDEALGFWCRKMPSKINNVDICFVAPGPDGDYWGSFLMLLAKARDALFWIFRVCNRSRVKGDRRPTAINLRFEGPSLNLLLGKVPF